jgi:hypothetical protein
VRAVVAAIVIVGALILLTSRRSAAEVEIADNNGWRLTTDGRVDNFLSVMRGNGRPNGQPPYLGLDEEITPDNKIASTRLRSGFIENVIGFELNRELADGVTAKARVALWMLSAGSRSAGDAPAIEAREAFLKIDGPWGGFLAGRTMSLFSRGAILLNYDIEHGYGLGSPCATRVVQGGSCGHSGFGVLFPGFHSGLVYNTPKVGGLQLSAGLYDPIELPTNDYRRTPYPRAEAEATLKVKHIFKAFLGGLWQRLSRNRMGATDPVTGVAAMSSQDVDAMGVNYGLGVNVGPVALGATGYYGKGLGYYLPLEDNPIDVITATGALRIEDGYYGAASVTFGDTRLAAGIGVSRGKKGTGDPPDTSNVVIMKQQLGVSAGVYQTCYKTVILALEYFGSQFTWYDTGQMVGSDIVVTRPQQAVNFVNVGATLFW